MYMYTHTCTCRYTSTLCWCWWAYHTLVVSVLWRFASAVCSVRRLTRQRPAVTSRPSRRPCLSAITACNGRQNVTAWRHQPPNQYTCLKRRMRHCWKIRWEIQGDDCKMLLQGWAVTSSASVRRAQRTAVYVSRYISLRRLLSRLSGSIELHV